MKVYPTARISERTQVLEFKEDGEGEITIGDFVLVTVPILRLKPGCQINAGTRIVGRMPCMIGANAVVSYDVCILTASDRLAPRMDDAAPQGSRNVIAAPVHIGDYCYIGAQALLMPGVEMKTGSVVRAQSYVKPFSILDEWTVYGGRPVVPLSLRKKKR